MAAVPPNPPPISNPSGVPNAVLFAVGLVLLLLPLVFVPLFPNLYGTLSFHFRLLAAIGGALVGGSLPGFLHVTLGFARAGGALAFFLLIYVIDPPEITHNAFSDLEPIATNLVDAANEARANKTTHSTRPLPTDLVYARSRFEAAWSNASLSERRALSAKLAFSALLSTSRLYRVQERSSERKTSSLQWVDEGIRFFEQTENPRYLAEFLLDKAAIYLEISQREHTEPDTWRRIAQDGDSVMARAYSLVADDQKATALRIWSRFYYNLARPRSGNLSENWDNNYLLLSLDKMQEAQKRAPGELKNIVQLARVTQKAATNPPQDRDMAWTQRMRKTQQQLLAAWHAAEKNTSAPMARIPPLNILAVLTMDVVRREWDLHAVKRVQEAEVATEELSKVALRAQREALALVRNTALEEDYDFDLYYDLARILAVQCRILHEVNSSNSGPICREAVRNLKEATRKATSIQLKAALQSLDRDPNLSATPQLWKDEMKRELQNGL